MRTDAPVVPVSSSVILSQLMSVVSWVTTGSVHFLEAESQVLLQHCEGPVTVCPTIRHVFVAAVLTLTFIGLSEQPPTPQDAIRKS